MQKFQQTLLIALFIGLALLITACQQTISNESPPPAEETTISQDAAPSPTAIATPTSTPTSTPTPTSLPTSGSQGDQLPTRTPTPLPTPTAIPADAPNPTASNTLAPSPTTIPLPNEVDLSTLDESLALLDRMERRSGGEGGSDLSFLSGEWSGTRTLFQAGQCGYNREPTPVTLRWMVSDSGQVTIQQSQSTSWIGNIDANLNISLHKSGVVSCNFSPESYQHSYTADYSGTITEQGIGAYSLNMEATEEWCPPNCVFRVRYELTKQ